MSQDSKENATIGEIYGENIFHEAHPSDGDAGTGARDAIHQLKEDIHRWVETNATEDELREILDRISEIENPAPPTGTGATLRHAYIEEPNDV